MKQIAKVMGLLLPFIFSQQYAQADVDINYRGTLVADACQLSSDTAEQIVEFPDIATRNFKKHSRSAPKKFELRLIECDLSAGEIVNVTFYGTESGEQPGTFAITEGDAKGISIAIETENGDAVKPSETLRPVTLLEEGNTLRFRAYIQGNDHDAVTEGSFSSSVNFLMEYE